MEAVAVPERIDADNALEVLDDLMQRAPTGPHPLTLDLSPLKHFDSSALSLLLQLVRRCAGAAAGPAQGPDAARAAGTRIVLLHPPEKLQELAELYGVADLLFGAVAGTTDEAAGGAVTG